MRIGELMLKELLLTLPVIVLTLQECRALDYWRVEGLTFQVEQVREVEGMVVEVVVDGGESRLLQYDEAVVFLLERSVRGQFPTEREILASLLAQSKFSDELLRLLLRRYSGERVIVENFPALVDRAEAPLSKLLVSESLSREAAAEIVARFQSQLRCHWLYQAIKLQLPGVTLGDTLMSCLTGDAEPDVAAVGRLNSLLTGAIGGRVKGLLQELESCGELDRCLVGFGWEEGLGRYFSLRRQRLLATDLQQGRMGNDELLRLIEPLQLEPLTPEFHELLIHALINSKESYMSPTIARAAAADPRVAEVVKARAVHLPFRWKETAGVALLVIWLGYGLVKRVKNYRASQRLFGYFGLPVGADRVALKERFRQMVKQLHPDLVGSQTQQDYLELVEKYRILRERLPE